MEHDRRLVDTIMRHFRGKSGVSDGAGKKVFENVDSMSSGWKRC